MKFKRLIVLGALLLVLFVAIGVTTANENTTVESMGLDAEVNSADGSEIISSDVETTVDNGYEGVKIIDSTEYDTYGHDEDEHVLDYEDQLITCKVMDSSAFLDDAYVFMEDEKGNVYEAWLDDDEGYYWFECKLPVGKHEITVYLDDSGYYDAEPLTYNVNIEKSYFYGTVSCKSYYGTVSDTLTMKATVKDSYDDREDGTVTFKVNGKSYTVKTKNGVATKTIRIKKAGTYTYTAVFKSGNYIDSGVGKGKLYVYSTSKKARTFKIKKNSIVLPVSKYKKLIKAKNTKKTVYFTIKTNKFIKQTYRKYNNLGKYTLKTVNARILFYIAYGGKDGCQGAMPNKYSMYFSTKYQYPDSFCKPALVGNKQSSEINKLNNVKLKNYSI